MIKNRIVVREKSTNKNRTFVLFSCLHLYTFKKMSDIIGTVTRTNSKNMTESEPGIIRYVRVLFYPQKSVGYEFLADNDHSKSHKWRDLP